MIKMEVIERTKIECDECGELKPCVELFGGYYCDDCNARLYERIDKRIKIKGIKIDDML